MVSRLSDITMLVNNKAYMALKQWLLCLFVCLYSHQLAAFDQQHHDFDSLLQNIVRIQGHQSTVDYAQLKTSPQPLNDYLTSISAVSRDQFSTWTEKQQLAFLINAYNALTLNLILSEYPDLESIKDLGSFFTSPWKKNFFSLWGEPHSLDYIEHDVLRREYNEPRLHFVLVCASLSCPPLMPYAYTADELEQQLSHATRNFLRDSERNYFERSNKTLHLSPIFKWYKEDFVSGSADLQHFVAPWMTDDLQQQQNIIDNHVTIQFTDYDWSLNDLRQAP